MKRLLFFAILLCLLWYFGTHGQSIKDFVLAPVNMVKGTSSGLELYNIRKALIVYYRINQTPLPAPQFHAYLRQEFKNPIKDPALDPWGQPYRYQVLSRGFRLESSGPDRTMGTRDDLCSQWKEQGNE